MHRHKRADACKHRLCTLATCSHMTLQRLHASDSRNVQLQCCKLLDLGCLRSFSNRLRADTPAGSGDAASKDPSPCQALPCTARHCPLPVNMQMVLQGVMYSHRSNYLHALLVAFKDVIGLGSSSCFYAIVPMFHANSWGLVFAAPMTGARLVLPGEGCPTACFAQRSSMSTCIACFSALCVLHLGRSSTHHA